ncbi:flagellum-specific peptidoglycan hydrolase FlgJ [Nonlabens dokdonensis]|uniref:Peptidoglycan hydrolase n=2 Tax=Nonlabens dokdonensis TaxID=328515 RepID=L7WB76_NONDD|nr:glucosaminidase domain-containing protein [Nonlabens dokdonensis]AGC77339.1 glucosaminidase, LysM domain protein [Nonlabens dokdonensis DSW-6]PZX40866.1 flagellum-specific peptidoglycan hydrolase FlgJ [Nonlabens dokdonensis]
MKITFRYICTLLILGMLLASCGSKKRVVTRKANKTTRTVTKPPITEKEEDKVTSTTKPRSGDKVENYVDDYKDVAMEEMKLYKIPASITLAQGILESGSGSGRLAVEANNHFGIKCHTGWTGGRIYHDDDEDQECFRTYNDASYSYRDHSLFLKDRKRYAGLFLLDIDDYKGWARGLRRAGYATDKRYPQKLISLIERYELYRYDNIALGKDVDEKPRVIEEVEDTQNSGFVKQHIVVKGDSLYRLSIKYNTTVEQLKKLNKLKSNDLSIGQVLIVK